MTIAISVKNLRKRYQIGAAETKFRYNMLRDVLVDTLYAPVRLAKAAGREIGPQGQPELCLGVEGCFL